MKVRSVTKDRRVSHAPVAGPSSERRYNSRLKDTKIFLQLHGCRGAAKLERDICLLGGIIEKCFSREVQCLITSRGLPTDYDKSKEDPMSSPSPVTPSPFNMGSVEVDSPQGHSPGSREPRIPLTRGKAMAQAAKTTKTYGSMDIVEAARSWKIKIVHIDTALRWIAKHMEKLPTYMKDSARNDNNSSRQIKSKRLRGAYMKFESLSKHYRPVHQEFKVQPQIHFESPAWTCPFMKKGDKIANIDERGEGEERDPQGVVAGVELIEDSPKDPAQNNKYSAKKKGPSSRSEDWFGGRALTTGEARSLVAEKKRAEMKKGFCEMCNMKYDNIDKHVRSDVHRKYVRNDQNYASLDRVIKSGPNVQQFIKDICEAHQALQTKSARYSNDEVLLLPGFKNGRKSASPLKPTKKPSAKAQDCSPNTRKRLPRHCSPSKPATTTKPEVTVAKRRLIDSPKRKMCSPVKQKPVLTPTKTGVNEGSPHRKSTRAANGGVTPNSGKQKQGSCVTPKKQTQSISKIDNSVKSPVKGNTLGDATADESSGAKRLTRNRIHSVEGLDNSNKCEQFRGKVVSPSKRTPKMTPVKTVSAKCMRETRQSPRLARNSQKDHVQRVGVGQDLTENKHEGMVQEEAIMGGKTKDSDPKILTEMEKGEEVVKENELETADSDPSSPASVNIQDKISPARTRSTIKKFLKKKGSPRVMCERMSPQILHQYANTTECNEGNGSEVTEPMMKEGDSGQGSESSINQVKRDLGQVDGSTETRLIRRIRSSKRNRQTNQQESNLQRSEHKSRVEPNVTEPNKDFEIFITGSRMETKSEELQSSTTDPLTREEDNSHGSPRKRNASKRTTTPVKRTPRKKKSDLENISQLPGEIMTSPIGNSTPLSGTRSKCCIKKTKSWSLLTQRSMTRILEEESDTEFEGFTEDSVDLLQIPSDASYEEFEGDVESSKEFEYRLSCLPQDDNCTSGKIVVLPKGLDCDSSPLKLDSTTVTPVKNILKNMSNLMSDASSDWDENIDDFFNDQVKKQSQDTPVLPTSSFLSSPRRSPRKNLKTGLSPFKFTGSPVKSALELSKASPLNRTPKRMLLTKPRHSKTPISLNQTWGSEAANSSLLSNADHAVQLWVGPAKNEKYTPSYVQKSLNNQALRSPASNPRSPVVGKKPKDLVPDKNGSPQTNPETKKSLQKSSIEGSTFGSPISSRNMKIQDGEKKDQSKEKTSGYDPHRTPTLSAKRIDGERSDSDSELSKKKLLKFSSDRKKKLSVGFASYEFTGKTKFNKTPTSSSASSEVVFTDLGSTPKISSKEALDTTPRSKSTPPVPLRRTPRKTQVEGSISENKVQKEGNTPTQNQSQTPTSRNRLVLDSPNTTDTKPKSKSEQRTPSNRLSLKNKSESSKKQDPIPETPKSHSVPVVKKTPKSPAESVYDWSAEESLNDSNASASTTSTSWSVSPSKKLHKLLQLHSLDVIQCGPRRKSSNNASIVRFSSPIATPECSPALIFNNPIHKKVSAPKTKVKIEKKSTNRRSSSKIKTVTPRRKDSGKKIHPELARLYGSSKKSESARIAHNIKAKALGRLRSKSLNAALSVETRKKTLIDQSKEHATGSLSCPRPAPKRGPDTHSPTSNPAKRLRLEISPDTSTSRTRPTRNRNLSKTKKISGREKKKISYTDFF